jgi:hypothetical protein
MSPLPLWVSRFTLFTLLCAPLRGYSVLTHEAIIDTAWEQNIKPLLLKKFPQASDAELKEAHASAYAGCIVQDMGYYSFGNKLFSDMAHYVRTGGFVINLIREARTVDEYAFSLGALAHYAADTKGHLVAVNRSVPIEYPKLERKFGHTVTYADDPIAHIQVEFSFDVLQVARGNYAPQAYHDFIGFRVPKDSLERAFADTYSLQVTDVVKDEDRALATYRHRASSLIPKATRVAWQLKKDELMKTRPGITRRAFIYNLSRASYRKEWGGKYEHPGLGSAVLAFFIRIIPKIGPLRALAFKAPTGQTERLFETSFEQTLNEYRRLLAETGAGTLVLENLDLDTGGPTRPAEYSLADRAYAQLAIKLAGKPPESVDPELRDEVLTYYRDPGRPFALKKDKKQWRQTLEALQKLRAETQAAAAATR